MASVTYICPSCQQVQSREFGFCCICGTKLQIESKAEYIKRKSAENQARQKEKYQKKLDKIDEKAEKKRLKK